MKGTPYSVGGILQIVLLGMSVMCNGPTWCLEPRWVCKPELPNQGSNETPKHGRALANNGGTESFEDTRVDLQLNEQVQRESELHNEKVKKNRDILKRLIHCVIFLGKQELSFRGHDENKSTSSNYVELLSLSTTTKKVFKAKYKTT